MDCTKGACDSGPTHTVRRSCSGVQKKDGIFAGHQAAGVFLQHVARSEFGYLSIRVGQ